jgi:hypothetical protein
MPTVTLHQGFSKNIPVLLMQTFKPLIQTWAKQYYPEVEIKLNKNFETESDFDKCFFLSRPSLINPHRKFSKHFQTVRDLPNENASIR